MRGAESVKARRVMRPGKTKRDKERGAWGARFTNRQSDPGRRKGR